MNIIEQRQDEASDLGDAVHPVSSPVERSDEGINDASNASPAETRRARLPGLSLVIVGLLVLAAAVLYFANQRNDQVDESAAEARTLGTTRVEELFSYDYRSIDEEFSEERKWLTGDFASEYKPLIADSFGPQAEETGLVTHARVVAGGIEKSERHEVDLVLFMDIQVQLRGREETISGSRLRVTLQDVDGDWLISSIDPI